MNRINLQQAGAALLLLSAGGLALARSGEPPSRGDLAPAAAALRNIELRKDHVSPLELAGWLVQGRNDFIVIDVRPAWEYDVYHLPKAVNIPLSRLDSAEAKKLLTAGKKGILCSSGGTH